MGFPVPPAAGLQQAPAEGSYIEKLQKILMGGGTGLAGGTLDESAQKAARNQAMLAMAAQLMQAGGQSDRRVNFGEALGSGLQAGMQAGQQAEQHALQSMLIQSQIQKSKQKDRGKLVTVMDPATGKPVLRYEGEAEGQQPYMKPGSEYGAYQPGDYTPASWAKFLQSKDPAVLERYSTPRQEFSPSFQNVTRNLPDGSTQQGTFNTRTGEYNWAGEIVPPGQKARVDAAGRAQGEIAGTRAAKSPIAYATYQSGIQSLESAMEGTNTGPLAGRIPAITANQQIAEGAEATMAPVLKQLFRDAGEGTFTDADQAMLMKMVPTRTDHPEARRAKIQMIDGIVRAKLGLGMEEEAASPQTSSVGIGQTTTINGVKVKRVK